MESSLPLAASINTTQEVNNDYGNWVSTSVKTATLWSIIEVIYAIKEIAKDILKRKQLSGLNVPQFYVAI